MKNYYKSTQKDEQGFVSILVCVIIMIILSLITIGFARVMQREARQALDRQLSTQAFYAAESGVNDAVAIARANPQEVKSDCQTPAVGPYSTLDSDLDNTNNVAYTCLLVNPAPGNLTYDDVSTERSTLAKVRPASGNMNELHISWQSSDPAGLNTFRPAGVMDLPPSSGAGSWGATTTGMLRVSLYPIRINGAGNLEPGDRDDLDNDARSYFLYPQTDPGSPAVPSAADIVNHNGGGPDPNDGLLLSGKCNANRTPRRCTAIIRLNGGLASSHAFYVRLKSVYNNVSVDISAQNGGTPEPLTGSQILIDSTGKTKDVFRRIQVRIPTDRYYNLPEFAIETADDICKRITVAPPGIMSDECDPASGAAGSSFTNPPPPIPGLP